MPIVLSSYTVGHLQSDGSRYVTERHTDSTGKVYELEYRSTDATDKDAVLAARALKISARLADAEADEVINGD